MAATKRPRTPKAPKVPPRPPFSMFGGPPMVLTTEQKVAAAREMLFSEFPFLAYLASNLPFTLIPPGHPDEQKVRTAATDGRRILWNTAFVDQLDLLSLAFVYAHEVMHCAFEHLWRRGSRDPKIFNIATDGVINGMLRADHMIFTPPADWAATGRALVDIPGAEKKNAETVYDELIKDAQEGKPPPIGGGPNPEGTVDGHEYWPGDEENDPDPDIVQEWKDHVREAKKDLDPNKPHHAAILLEIDRLTKPKINWHQLLTDGLFWPGDYEWLAPYDRRMPGFPQPTLTGHRHQVVIAVDTSGSTTGPKLAEFWSEMMGLLWERNVQAIVLLADDTIKAEIDVQEFEPSMFEKARGGGGTDFRPVFNRLPELEAMGFHAERLIYLTDLEGTFPETPPEIPTLWVVSAEDKDNFYPFGTLIPLVD